MDFVDKKPAVSDDEDDLELLRMAALQTLKKPTINTVNLQPVPFVNKYNGSPHMKKGRGYHSGPGRGARNFNGRNRNTNLISIMTIQPENEAEEGAANYKNVAAPKLILPQDRYCNKNQEQSKEKETSSKFNRYDNSDDSESEEESEPESEVEEKLERSNSLEALMQELEYEITGEKPVRNQNNKLRKRKIRRQESESENVESQEPAVPIPEETEGIKVEDSLKVEVEEHLVNETKEERLKIRPCSPKYQNKSTLNGGRRHVKNYPNFAPQHNISYGPPPQNFLPMHNFNPNNLYNNVPFVPYHPQLPPPLKYHPQRPLSPLNLNTEALSNITMAPLSPRSAAFVLQNREIIERRKKSPRRSYSRSPSPRFMRSKSPRRSKSPKRRSKSPMRRSKSPTRRSKSPLRRSKSPLMRQKSPLMRLKSPLMRLKSPLRRSKSPLRPLTRSKSPIGCSKSPVRRSLSPRRFPKSSSPKRTSPGRRNRSPPARLIRRNSTERKNSPRSKLSIRERLGARTTQRGETKRKHTNSPEIPPKQFKESEEVTIVNLVLEARRRKFEGQEVYVKDKIIRLKSKDDNLIKDGDRISSIKGIQSIEGMNSTEVMDSMEGMESIEDFPEDDTLDLGTTDTIMGDIFSDEESDDENEGRFKSSSNNKRNVSVVPFTQLVNGPNRDIKTKSLDETCRDNSRKDRDRSGRRREVRRNRSPPEDFSKLRKDKKLPSKSRIIIKHEKKAERVTSPIENKKIEIKIRNPAKYETATTCNVVSEEVKKERNVRKVDVAKEVEENENIPQEPEVIIDEEDGDDNKKSEAGDLRAQLSRKRAERQHKLPLPEDVQSRLLHNALQGAVFKKCKKSKRKETAPKENVAVKRTSNDFVKCGLQRIKHKSKIIGQERQVRLVHLESRILLERKDKLPIHFRLGLTKESDALAEIKKKKKSKTRSSDQV